MKKTMRKIIVLMMIGVFVLSGCKKNVGTPEDNATVEGKEDESENEVETIKFGFSAIDMKNPYFITLENAIREGLDEEKYTLITKNPAGDKALQEKQIREMVDEGIQAIFISPVEWESITKVLEELKENDIKIINIDTQVKEIGLVDAYIGSDNVKAGSICGEDLIKRFPEGGKVAILECPTQNSINDRIKGFEEAIAKAEKGFEIVVREDTGGDFEKALEAAKLILEEHPDIDVIMCGNDQIAVGAVTAINLAELKGTVIYGVDGSPDIKKELKKVDSQVAGTAAQSPISIGKTAAKTAISMINKEDYEKEIFEDVFMIDKDNVDMYGVDGWQ